MTTSLAQQLRGIASLDADRITSNHGAPSGKSYLFPPSQAAAMDMDAIYNVALSGYEELLEIDPDMEQFEDDLFSETSKATDRMMLPKDANKDLDVKLEKCLRRLSQWLTLKSGAKCFEWLVRRFR
jgi:U3 small nucleolar RNA-associated protein 10